MRTISRKGSKIKIYLLGDFKITLGAVTLSEKESKSSKVWRLLQYLIVQRHRFVPHNELMKLFYTEKSIENPVNTLRTMVYRARVLLDKAGFAMSDKMILSKSGGYTWNNKLPYTVDVDEFEAAYDMAETGITQEEVLETLLKAIDIYRGDFLPESAGERWVMPLGRKYRSMYIDCVYKALKILFLVDRIDEAEELCIKALRIDPFDEKILEYHLQALLASGKNAEAFDKYRSMETMFFEVKGTKFSEDLRKLYNRIQRPAIDPEVSLDDTLSDWVKDATFPGAYYVDLSVFKTIYQIEARSANRTGKSTYIARIDTKIEKTNRRGNIMKHLGMAIPNNLRKGDLFTRSSPNQYMLMLQNLTYENCDMVVNRVLRSMEENKLSKIEEIHISALTPIE